MKRRQGEQQRERERVRMLESEIERQKDRELRLKEQIKQKTAKSYTNRTIAETLRVRVSCVSGMHRKLNVPRPHGGSAAWIKCDFDFPDTRTHAVCFTWVDPTP